MNTKGLDYTLLALVIIGAVNWGLIGLFRFDLVSYELAHPDYLWNRRNRRSVSLQRFWTYPFHQRSLTSGRIFCRKRIYFQSKGLSLRTR